MSQQPFIVLTPAALAHFAKLIEQEQGEVRLNLRINVNNSGTMHADVGIVFCPVGDEDETDLAISFPEFILYVDHESIPALRDAVIDYKLDDLGGQLSVKAPHIRGNAPDKNAPLIERVKYLLDNEINPSLASHRGFVTLVDIVDNKKVILRFGGGCHGCSMSDVTLKSGIEKTLLQHCPEIVAVIDATEHELGANPFYR